jgi:hypothetical protein
MIMLLFFLSRFPHPSIRTITKRFCWSRIFLDCGGCFEMHACIANKFSNLKLFVECSPVPVMGDGQWEPSPMATGDSTLVGSHSTMTMAAQCQIEGCSTRRRTTGHHHYSIAFFILPH